LSISATSAAAPSSLMAGATSPAATLSLHDALPIFADRGKENYGGFSGYEEHRNRQRAEEASKEMWRQAGRRLLEAHQDQPLEMKALVGRDEDFDSIAAELHPYLRELPQARLRVDISTVTPTDLARFIDEQTEELRTRRAEELI